MVSRLGSQCQRLLQPHFPVASTILTDASKTPGPGLESEQAGLFLSYIRDNDSCLNPIWFSKGQGTDVSNRPWPHPTTRLRDD